MPDNRLSLALSTILIAHDAPSMCPEFEPPVPIRRILAKFGFTPKSAEQAIIDSLGLERTETGGIRCTHSQFYLLCLVHDPTEEPEFYDPR